MTTIFSDAEVDAALGAWWGDNWPTVSEYEMKDLRLDMRAALTAALSIRHGGVKALGVDALAQEIRRVDGNHDLGAGALAEALMPFIASPAQEIADEGDANVAEQILRSARRFIAAEHKHASLLSSPETEFATSRDEVDMEHANLVTFTVEQVDQALRIVRRRRLALTTPVTP